jgi:thioredoxin reductase
MSSETLTPIKAKTIAIIGAGPSGVIAAKHLLAQSTFSKIVLFEQRSTPGGAWNYTPSLTTEDLFTIPQTDPTGKNQDPEWLGPSSSDSRSEPSFLSPMYEALETNIPRCLMKFQDFDWPPDTPLFPPRETVLQYIADYGEDVQHLIRYETQIVHAAPTSSSPHTAWTVTIRNLRTNQPSEETFDALIVANGHFTVPHVPDIPGIAQWNDRYPGTISHSKYLRRAEEYKGKKVLVVGDSASGTDICAHLLPFVSELLWSSRSPTGIQYPPIARFLPNTAGVTFANGTTSFAIDAVIFCTGYFYSLPFLSPTLNTPLISTGHSIHHTYAHIFLTPQPTLSFIALPSRVIPFAVAEAQAAVIARVYAGRLVLPPLAVMQQWGGDREGEGIGHKLEFPKDAEYVNEMSGWAMSARELETRHAGLTPPVWGEWEFWVRERVPVMKKAFKELGEGRGGVRTVEELGFSFEAWKRQKEMKKKMEGDEKSERIE